VYANRQRLGDFFTAARAYLAGVMGWNFNHCPTSFFRFVDQQIKEHTPSRIRNASGEMPVSHHPLDVQVLHIDVVISLYIMIRRLVEEVLSLVRHFLVGSGNKNTGFTPAIGTLALPAKRSISAPQEPLGLSQVCGVLHSAAVGVDTEGLNAHINADLSGGVWEFPCRYVVTGKGNKPLPGGTPPNGDGLDVALDIPGQKHLEPTDVLHVQVSAFKSPSSLFQCEGVVSVKALKSREASLIVARADRGWLNDPAVGGLDPCAA